MAETNPTAKQTPRIRWWPGAAVLLLAVAVIVWVRLQGDWPFQRRNLESAKIVIVATILLLV